MNDEIKKVLEAAARAEADQTVADAMSLLREGARRFPENDQIQFQLGRLSERAKAFNAALGHYQSVAERHEKLPPDVALGMARSLLGLKRTDRAR